MRGSGVGTGVKAGGLRIFDYLWSVPRDLMFNKESAHVQRLMKERGGWFDWSYKGKKGCKRGMPNRFDWDRVGGRRAEKKRGECEGVQ